MSSPRQLVGIAAVVGILLVGITSSAPDMFTALVDMQRALSDEQAASILLRQYINNERQRLQDLELYAYMFYRHKRSIFI